MEKNTAKILQAQDKRDSSFQQLYRATKGEYMLPDCAHNDSRRRTAMIDGRGRDLAQQLQPSELQSSFHNSHDSRKKTKPATIVMEEEFDFYAPEILMGAGILMLIWYASRHLPEIQQAAHSFIKLLGN